MLHYYRSVNKKTFPCNITVNDLAILEYLSRSLALKLKSKEC